MGNKLISYYDLLGMVQEGNAPEKIMVKISSTVPRIYIAEYDYEEFNYYRLENEKEEDENYDYYLSECFLESMVFDKCIEILDEEDEFEDINELENYKIDDDTIKGLIKSINTLNDDFTNSINQLIKNQKKIIEEIKELKK